MPKATAVWCNKTVVDPSLEYNNPVQGFTKTNSLSVNTMPEFPYKHLDVLKKWAEHYGARYEHKSAFIDAPSAAMPPGGMPPEMMGGGMPMDPSMQAMAEEEMMRSLIRDEIQKALGSTDAGQGVASPSGTKRVNKTDEAISQIMRKMEEQQKIIVTALRKAGVEIPLADILSFDGSVPQQQGLAETLQPGQTGTNEAALVSKVAEFDADVEQLVKLAKVRDSLNRSAMGRKLVPFDPLLPEKNYFEGLFR